MLGKSRKRPAKKASSRVSTAAGTFLIGSMATMAIDAGEAAWSSVEKKQKFRYPKKRVKETGEVAAILGAIAAGGSVLGHWRAARM